MLACERIAIAISRRTIVEEISFVTAAGTITALLGVNGAGKSTILRGIVGALPLAAGCIRVGGADLAGLDRNHRARLVAYVPQTTALLAGPAVRTVVAMGRFAHQGWLGRSSPRDREAIDQALAATDTVDLADRRFDELSAGERQRVLIARAIATDAPIMVLDEPTAALDIGHALDVVGLLRQRAGRGLAIVVVLHALDEAVRCADQAVLIDHGRVVRTGTVAEVVSSPDLAQAYGIEVVPGGGLGFRRSRR
jgi:iron complex transport system ATP-binding protein